MCASDYFSLTPKNVLPAFLATDKVLRNTIAQYYNITPFFMKKLSVSFFHRLDFYFHVAY